MTTVPLETRRYVPSSTGSPFQSSEPNLRSLVKKCECLRGTAPLQGLERLAIWSGLVTPGMKPFPAMNSGTHFFSPALVSAVASPRRSSSFASFRRVQAARLRPPLPGARRESSPQHPTCRPQPRTSGRQREPPPLRTRDEAAACSEGRSRSGLEPTSSSEECKSNGTRRQSPAKGRPEARRRRARARSP